MKPLRLTPAEREAGVLAVFECPTHGPVVITFKTAAVSCGSCGKAAKPTIQNRGARA